MLNLSSNRISVKSRRSLSNMIEDHGDLVYDLCRTICDDPVIAHQHFKSAFKEIGKTRRSQRYYKYERAWILNLICDRLITHYRKKAMTLEEMEFTFRRLREAVT